MTQEKGRVDELSEELYSRTRYHDPSDRRAPVRDDVEEDAPESWESPQLDEMLRQDRRKPEGHPVMKKIFTIALIFFLVAAAAAAYIFFGGGNFISSKNVDITIVGPTSVDAGEPIELAITVVNKNNADLQLANLSIEYPEGSREADDMSQSIATIEEELGVIKAGEQVTRTLSAALFGEKGEIKKIRVSLEYKVTGSNATYSKQKDYEVSIGAIPVAITVDIPSTVTAGEPFTTTLTIVPNGNQTLQNVLVRGEYPYGFAVLESDPSPFMDDNMWSIGTLSPNSKKTITITGQLLGENSEERTFRFYTGLADPDNLEKFGTNLATALETTAIDRPSVGLSIRLNGEAGSAYIAPAGEKIRARIDYKNNLPERLEDARVEVRVTGTALDESTVDVEGDGYYRDAEDMVIWDDSSVESLERLSPGDGGDFNFSFSSLPNLPPGTNQIIEIAATFTGKPQGENRPISITERRIVKIASAITLNAETLYSRGVFKNTGPVPPKADQKTTYTLHFTVGNTQNDVLDAKLTGTLGSNVKILNLGEDGDGEDITFDEATKKVTWDIGKLHSGSGFSSGLREASIQVELTPTSGQVGGVPILLNNIAFTGIDEFTDQNIVVTSSALTTRISTDPSYVQGDERVVR